MYLMNLLMLEVKCKVNPQMSYTRYLFSSFTIVYLFAAVVGVFSKYDNDVDLAHKGSFVLFLYAVVWSLHLVSEFDNL